MVSFCEILVFTCSVISWFVGVYVCLYHGNDTDKYTYTILLNVNIENRAH